LDADYFKTFNDTYGHPAGDRVLCAIADSIVRNMRRPGDMAGRYGGEEFMVLLPETEMSGALKVAEHICAAVADLNIPHAGSPIERVTVSIGIAVAYPAHGEPEARLVKEADEALYEAKQTGRNRVCTSVGDNLSKPKLHWIANVAD
jgi:diguanylate cyclase (GGDEF)-like protein